MCMHYLPLICLLNTNTMITTKRKSKIAKRFSGAQNHKIALLTDTQNILKVRYSIRKRSQVWGRESEQWPKYIQQRCQCWKWEKLCKTMSAL